MFLHFKSFIFIALILVSGVCMAAAQEATPSPSPTPAAKDDKKTPKTAAPTAITAEQIAEASIFYAYGLYVGGRTGLNQIRKTGVERGKVFLTNPDGTNETATYERRTLRGESLETEKIRLDQEFPGSRFSLVYKDSKVVGLFNDSVFTPREEASKAFTNQIWRGLEGLLRYKENSSKVALDGKVKVMGVDYHVLDVTDKQNRTTRYLISAKSYRVMALEYTEDGVKYTRKFYDYRYAQGTLVPYRNTLLADGKQIEETTVLTVTYGQKIEEELFGAN